VRVSGEVVPGDGPGARSSPDLVTRIVTLRQATGEAEGGGGCGVGFTNNVCVYFKFTAGIIVSMLSLCNWGFLFRSSAHHVDSH
jgi:hypothetical protein